MLIFFTLFEGELTFQDPDFQSYEFMLLSSRNATSADFRRIITALLDYPHRATVETALEAFYHWFDRAHQSGDCFLKHLLNAYHCALSLLSTTE